MKENKDVIFIVKNVFKTKDVADKDGFNKQYGQYINFCENKI
jgi:hypothetical protein